MPVNGAITPKDIDGHPIIRPTFEENDGMSAGWEGNHYVAQPNSLNIFDKKITKELKLRGCWYEILDENSNIGDYVEVSVIDKDDVLGLFSTYGLTVGVDILELRKFVKTQYVSPRDAGRQVFSTNGSFDVLPGLYTRFYYNNIGSQPVNISATMFFYED